MGEWSASSGARVATVGHNPAASTGTVITASATANTKGSWAQIVAATPISASSVIVMLSSPSAAGDYLVDIGTGIANFETILVPNILYCRRASDACAHFRLPVGVPAGARLAARVQSTSASATVAAAIMLLSHGFPGMAHFGFIQDYGTALADSGGVSVDPGATLNTKNTWSQIVASTARPARWLMISIGNVGNNVRTNANWLFDVGIGSAGQEHVILANMGLNAFGTPDLVQPLVYGPFPVAIPSGSRIAAHAQCDISDATDRLFDIAVYGVV